LAKYWQEWAFESTAVARQGRGLREAKKLQESGIRESEVRGQRLEVRSQKV
jgi:hypothetical protein